MVVGERGEQRQDRERVHADALVPAELARHVAGDLGEEEASRGRDRRDDERAPELVAPEHARAASSSGPRTPTSASTPITSRITASTWPMTPSTASTTTNACVTDLSLESLERVTQNEGSTRRRARPTSTAETNARRPPWRFPLGTHQLDSRIALSRRVPRRTGAGKQVQREGVRRRRVLVRGLAGGQARTRRPHDDRAARAPDRRRRSRRRLDRRRRLEAGPGGKAEWLQTGLASFAP